MKRLMYFAVLMCCASLCWGQSDTGTPTDEAVMDVGGGYVTLNIGNLNLIGHANVRSKGGPIPFNATISQNVQVYVNGGIFWTTAADPATGLDVGYWSGRVNSSQIGTGGCPNNIERQVTSIQDEHGTAHTLPTGLLWDKQGCLHPNPIDAFTNDGSGLEVIIQPGDGVDPIGTLTSVYDKTGTLSSLHGALGGTVTDSHGNQITATNNSGVITFTDELSATPVLTNTGANSYTYNDGTGTLRSVTTSNPQSTYAPAFTCPGITNGTSTFITPLHSVSYPDGSSVTFNYGTDGRLSTVQVPTGATYTLTYSGGTNNQGLWCIGNGGSIPYSVSNATMTVTNGTGTWTFARTIGSGTWPNRVTTTTVTEPDGSKTVYTFKGEQSPILTGKVVKDTDGTTVLGTLTYCYDSTISNCNPQTVMAKNPTWVRVYHTVPGVTGNAEVDTQFDTYGNVDEVDPYDFGPTLVSKTYITQGSWNGSGCTAVAHQVGAICYSTTFAADGVTRMNDTTYQRDLTTGDVTQMRQWIGGSSWLATNYVYNANGTLASLTGPDGVQNAVAYNGTGGCNLLLPTSATNAIGTVSTTWDCNGAVPLTSTDLNGLVVTTTYGDSLYRVTQVSDNGGQAPILYTYPSATRSSKHMTFNSGASMADTTTTVNSLGQVLSIQQQTAPGSANYDTVSFTYDTSGRKASASTACTTTLGGTCATHAVEYTYDGASRPKTKTVKTTTPGVLTYSYPTGDIKTVLTPAPTGENSKIVQIEKDGLGRTTSVCQVVTSGLSGTGACGQRTAATGYKTTYTLDPLGRATQISRNSQTGGTAVNTTASYDALSRVTQSSITESGTATFVYDAVANDCSNGSNGLNGHLNRAQDSAGNVTCYYYDDSGRLTDQASISGPNSSVTPASFFCHDGNVALGCDPTGAHTVGRISDVGTSFAPYTTTANSESFGYDIYGRLSDIWENIPDVGVFHTTATYWDNGAVKTLSGVPGLGTISYGIDSQGRSNSGTVGATGVVSSVAYDSASNPSQINFTNGDKDTYTWDAPSQNMTQWQFTVGTANTTDTGVLTWNPNGTLKQMQITDNLSSTDTQTCTTGHDDLVRITSFNCGAPWSETYAYSPDYAGNVTKSGSLIFNPGYVPSSNRFASGSGCTYDANGNILHDCTLAQDYTWDAFGSMVSYAGNSVKNDAFGQKVEKVVGTTKTYFLYTPIGYVGTFSSLTGAVVARLPMPVGTSTSSGLNYLLHMDFMGSTRLTTNRAARTLQSVVSLGPMGEVYAGTQSGAQFEGQSQDTSLSLFDYDSIRYSGKQGRSISPTGGANGYVKDNGPF